ncbi:porin family protein [Dysgonomonas sp. ZJ279]|uniref:porin family protein n=1 Tax=Dysgonomonas sp. ZJ279 TaxID=2709796 RepID=UPI0013EBD4B7|nr:porin family protein [Dysgonomonas sp. ZJ279]
MKVKVLFLLFIFVPVIALNAQRLGVKAGVNLNNSKVDFNGMDADLYTGFNVGLISDFNLPFSGWKFNTGLLYSYEGFKLKEDYGNNMGITYHFITNNIEIPLNIRREFNHFVIKHYIQAGLNSSYALSGRIKDGESSRSLSFKNNADRFDFGASVGIGCYLTSKLQLLASYDHGLTESELVFGDQIISTKNRRWSLAVGYMF